MARACGLEEPVRARLADVVEPALAALAPSIERQRIALTSAIAPDTPLLRVQTSSLQRALASLLASAVDALMVSGVASPRIALCGASDAEGVLLSIRDNGRRPGAQAHRERCGNGLARAIVRTQGGTLSVLERAEEFCARIWLPAAPR